MKKQISWILLCVFTVCSALVCAGALERTVTVMAENAPVERKFRIVIDAGHGEPDGGAISCTGLPESTYNLQIALRLNDLLKMMGFETVMIRTDESSVYTEGKTIASKKISDLRNRVQLVNSTQDPLLISIHQNHYPDSRYSGGVILYADTPDSQPLAQEMQQAFVEVLNPGSKRKCKKAEGIYLMEHIRCPGILVECGFVSNPKEEALLRSPEYQKKLCCVIGSTLSRFLSEKENQPDAGKIT